MGEKNEIKKLGEDHNDSVHLKKELKSQIQDLERKHADLSETRLSAGKMVAEAMRNEQGLKVQSQNAKKAGLESQSSASKDIATIEAELSEATAALNKAEEKQASQSTGCSCKGKGRRAGGHS